MTKKKVMALVLVLITLVAGVNYIVKNDISFAPGKPGIGLPGKEDKEDVVTPDIKIKTRRVVLEIDAGAIIELRISGGHSFKLDNEIITPGDDKSTTAIESSSNLRTYLLDMSYREDLRLTITTEPGYVIKSVYNTLGKITRVQLPGGTENKQVHDFNPNLQIIEAEDIDYIHVNIIKEAFNNAI